MPATTVPDLLDRRADDASDQEIVFPDGRLTYPDLAAATRRLVGPLWAAGIRPGDHVGMLLPNRIDSVTTWLAVAQLGAVAVPVNPRLKPGELAYIIENADMRLLFAATELEPLLARALPGLADATPGRLTLPAAPMLRTVVAVDRDEPAPQGWISRTGFESAAHDPVAVAAARAAVGAEDPALILYTSGTTSRPRGCVLDNAALVAEGEAVAERLGLDPADRFWTPLPMFHCGGYDVALAALAGGCGMVHVGEFDPATALRQLAEERCTIAFPAFETIWLPVLDHPDFPATDLSALRIVLNVGAPERLRSMQDRIAPAVQMSSYGMTESCGFCCIGSPDDPPEARATTSGKPLRHMEIRVCDPVTGRPAPAGTPGEVQFRGASRVAHYHRDPDLTAERIDDDGWFTSGDMAVADDHGRISFLSRLKDMLKVGGENVAAAEVEGILGEHPACGVVQVVAAPDARLGEVPAAFVQLRPGADATEQELIDFCLGTIATYKVPRYVRFVTEWPMSGTKVQKFRLRERIATELTDAGITQAPRLTSRPAPTAVP
ncbi:class I adenylate-forming enzyme family protein [Pseudonocardia parietis]|uniref:Fatty-acyl-CoA synthase n=1 Tax=Pseudonocardia parietis TaxID=570936 RepID=A0ABS4VTL3_9PSEU|nr:AMP-binding protein [Pseudonocardia parietis]MBP2367263.1 fatty-acyl-CoA synthase [Pseudonocardia parietis]